ncbi:MAG TPA: TonB-dependent receptor [Pyrinomonadaceae bacterium]|nr:TonB-dependent receptor [Pyrinomonadaceae bacterium]
MAGLLLVFAAFTATAQEFRGSLAGKILDPNGAVVPGSKVDIKNIETGIVSSATTGDDGAYSFALLAPGKYQLTVTKENFNTAVRDGIEVRVADRLTLDVQLEIGVTAMVTTVASALTLDTGTVNTGTVVSGKQISELPLTEGTAYQLATLAPGIAYTGNPLFTGPTSNGNLAAFRSNGATGANQITLDGSPNYAFDGGVGFSPPSDTVQEFKVQTNAFDAQQGYSAGATVNVAVKSGSNDFHGSGWYFNRDRSRTANNFFGNRSNQPRPIRTYHRFGGMLSGPILKDRTFFLVSYERLKDNVAEPQIFTVPTEAMRRGDFSALIVNRANIANSANTVIFNPFSGTQSGSNVVRTSFGCPTSGAVPANSQCNIIPSNLINPVAANLIKFYPLPNIEGVGGNASQIDNSINYSVQSLYHGFFFQDDWRVSKNLTLNIGLRYDLEQGLTERYNRILRGFDLGTPSPIDAQVRAAYTTAFNQNPANFVKPPSEFRVLGGYTFADENNRNVWEADRSNFQPRVGLSYSLNDKTVVRAGFGMFMAPFMIETPQQVGFAGTTPFVPSANNGLTFIANLTNPFPQGLSGIQPSFGSSLGLLTVRAASSRASVSIPDRLEAQMRRLAS